MKLLVDQLDQLLGAFQPHCRDTETLAELRALLHHEKEWGKAHYLSMRIRTKSINAFKAGRVADELQYSFEEVCAKTLHNLSTTKKPFDPDTPYWIFPLALKLAHALKLETQLILDIVAG